MLLFFKQKTAYEMRISDWSSDVCSSDLHLLRDFMAGIGEIFRLDALHVPGGKAGEDHHADDRDHHLHGGRADEDVDQAGDQYADQIGRASWRERVCQYV